MGDRPLNGRVAIVTGASHGTGVDIARAFAAAGAHVAVHYRSDRAAAEGVASSIRESGGVADVFAADVARMADVRRLLADVRTALGAPSIVVNNAGPFNDRPFTELAEADWDYVMSANLKSVYLAAQLVAPDMRAARWGRIVNIGATSGLVRSHGVYGLAKAALLHLTQSLALELAPAITVNAIVPSQIASPRTDGMVQYKAAAIAGTPLGRLVTQAEIARMAVRLCSPEFDFVTGQAIVMDGGRTLPRFPKLDLVQE
jgi:NAD(P)-dependent dehydrogenase (short-subunit alcohol dehydrogenase family)